MPFWTHKIGSEPETGECFDTKQDALNIRTDGYTVTRVLTDEEKSAWRTREQNRFDSREYTPIPWHDAIVTSSEWSDTAIHEPTGSLGAWVKVDKPACAIMRGHYAHVSLKDQGKIAYTPDDAFGADDRQLRVAPGRYLEQFAKDLFTPGEIAEYIQTIKAITGELTIARTSSEIRRVYTAPHSPGSCMDAEHHEYEDNPTRVYGDTDLGIAYIGVLDPNGDRTKDRISARCIVWPDKMLYGRMYGDGARCGDQDGDTTLHQILRMNGYKHGSMCGAHVRAIENDRGGYVMPYVDSIGTASLVRVNGRQMFCLDNGGDYDVQNTDGTTGECEPANTCENCGSECSEDECYCDSCNNNRSTCERCDHTTFDSSDGEFFEGSGVWLCSDCASSHSHDCEVCGDTFNEYDFSYRERRSRNNDLCADCHDDHSRCTECDTYTANDELTDDLCEDCKPEDHTRLVPARERGIVLRAHSLDAALPAFTVRTTDYRDVQVTNYVDLGVFIAHQTIGGSTFTLTHKLTCFAVSRVFQSLAQCQQAARALDTLNWAFMSGDAMPADTRAHTTEYLRTIGVVL